MLRFSSDIVVGGGLRRVLDRCHTDGILRRRLHPIHRGIGLADQRVLGNAMRRIGRDAEARGDRDLDAGIELERARAHRFLHAIRDEHGLIGIGLRKDDAELVAAEAHHFVDAAHRAEDPLRLFLQRARSGQMAVEVVDHLQVVEVEKDDAEERAVAARALDLFAEIRLEEAAIEGLGEGVSHRKIAAARQLIDVAEDSGDRGEVARDVAARLLIDFIVRADRHFDHADQVLLELQREDDHAGAAVERDEAPRGEGALQEIGRDAGKELAGLVIVRVVAEADHVALEPRVVQEERPAREAEDVQHRARDALGDFLRLDHRHQLVNLREVADFRFELRGMDRGVGEIAGEFEIARGTGEERVAIEHQLALAARRVIAEDEADEALARGIVEERELIGVEDHDAREVAFGVAGEGLPRTLLPKRCEEIVAIAVDADGLAHSRVTSHSIPACASRNSCFPALRPTSGNRNNSMRRRWGDKLRACPTPTPTLVYDNLSGCRPSISSTSTAPASCPLRPSSASPSLTSRAAPSASRASRSDRRASRSTHSPRWRVTTTRSSPKPSTTRTSTATGNPPGTW